MAGCCSPRAYGEFFTQRVARRDAKRYRKRGLDPTAASLVRTIGDVRGATVLDVGGGVGAIALELLQGGAERAITVELSPAYDEEARALARERGVEERVERRVADFAGDTPGTVPTADAVVLHRVVCCYPDYRALLTAASEHARRTLAFSFPRETWWIRMGFAAVNLFMKLRRCAFRGFVHPTPAVLAVPQERGFELDVHRAGTLWQIAVFRRTR